MKWKLDKFCPEAHVEDAPSGMVVVKSGVPLRTHLTLHTLTRVRIDRKRDLVVLVIVGSHSVGVQLF